MHRARIARARRLGLVAGWPPDACTCVELLYRGTSRLRASGARAALTLAPAGTSGTRSRNKKLQAHTIVCRLWNARARRSTGRGGALVHCEGYSHGDTDAFLVVLPRGHTHTKLTTRTPPNAHKSKLRKSVTILTQSGSGGGSRFLWLSILTLPRTRRRSPQRWQCRGVEICPRAPAVHRCRAQRRGRRSRRR